MFSLSKLFSISFTSSRVKPAIPAFIFCSGIIEDGRTISGSKRITTTVQPYEEELKQAEKEIYNTILVLNEDEKRKRIEDRAYDIVLEKAKNEKRTAKWEDYVEKEDTWMDYLRFYKSGKTAVTEHEKEIELIKKGVEDKKSIINKQAALQQLKTKAIANSVDRTLDKYSESVDEINLFSKNPNYNFYIHPGS